MRETMVEGPDPLLGSTVAGRYTVMRRIARGGMGVVYLAVQEGLGRAVALKIIRREAASDPVMQKRFEREARAVSALAHPAIVTVHDFGRTEDGGLFLAMEFVDGEPLRDALRRKKKFAFVETLPIIENIASALARAHGAGVVHRDLKPENVMLPRQSATTTGAVHAKVLDFGLAKPHDPEQLKLEDHLTRDGGFVGTPGYASPEQAEGAAESPRQDLYALGVLWYELLSGEHPFAAPTPMKVVVRQLHEEPPSLPPSSPHGSLADVPPSAVDLVRRLMARKADDRPESAHQVLDELARIRAALTAGGPPAASPSATPSPASSEYASTPEAPTLDGRAPPAPLVREAPQREPEHKTSATPAPPSRAAASPPSRAAWLVLAVVAAVAAGAFLVTMLSDVPTKPQTPASDGGAGNDAVDATDRDGHPATDVPRVQLRGVEIVIEDLPSFRALAGVRAVLGPTHLRGYSAGTATFLVVDAEAAGPLADQLQGLPLQSDLPLVLEVKELAPARLVLTAVRPEDASALADAGVLLDGGALLDAGDVNVVAPGGLAP